MHSKPLRAAALVLALAGAATAQVAILQIHVIEGEGAVHPPGARVARPLAVEVTDETGKPVEGAAVSFHLPDDGPTGAFLNGLRTEVVITDAQGRAALRGMTLNRVAGRFSLRIVASKEQARAGVISFQYIAEPHSGAAATAAPPASESRHGVSSRRARWMVVAALAAGGAAAGILSATRSGSTAAPAAPSSTLIIGPPSSTVVKP